MLAQPDLRPEDVLHATVERQRQELASQQELMRRQRATLSEQNAKIHSMEVTVLEQQAQLQAQAAELRALRYRHARDREAFNAANGNSDSPGRLRRSPVGHTSPARSSSLPRSQRPPSTRRQLQQALADKAVLVTALHKMCSDVARARADAHTQAEVSSRTLAAAWRLGELGQAGIALLDEIGVGATPTAGGHTVGHSP